MDTPFMFNSPHPGEFISEVYLAKLGLGEQDLAFVLDVNSATVGKLLKGTSGVSPEMAVRLSQAIGRSAESWLHMQNAYECSNASAPWSGCAP